jgi:diguanylate cyclase (GGDEF)-like protein/PAS domain S-box-containing protein
VLKPAETASDSACMATPGRLDALFDLSRKLASCLDLDDVLREVGLCASALTGAHAVTLERYDREARALVAFGSGAPADDTDVDVSRRVLKTHDPEVVVGEDGSSLVAALVSRGESVGVMRIRYHERHEFAQHEIEFFRSLADVVASAIANALLYARLTCDIAERERAETELRAAEWRYRKLVEDMPVGTYVNSLDGHMTYISPQIEPVLGYSPDDWVRDGGTLFSRILHPDDLEWVETRSAQCQENGAVFQEEYRLLAFDGRTVWVLDRTVQVCAPDGTPLFRQGFLLDITERKQAEERLAHLAYHDPLTGLPNRAMFNEHLELVLARARRTGSGAAVLFIDLDDFKLVNDSFGHSAGDELLRQVADRLGSVTRAGDLVARQGGDEFLILIGDFDGRRAEPEWMRTACDQIARKVRSALQAPFLVAGTELHTSASVGISVFPVDATDAEGMLKNGDIAMYKVKESGRDGHQLFASDGHDRVAQLSMAGRLRGAVGRGEMVLHYQPLIELESGAVVGVEALVRWNDPARGMVPPMEFIPLAERTGVIGPLSDWVIEEACRQGAEWRAQGLDLYVSVNMPPALWQPTAMRHVLRTIEQFGLHAGRLMIEITESAIGADGARIEPILNELHERGLRLAIDDFGTGHSSLSRLSQMMVTTLKIDRSFVHDLPNDRSAAHLVSAIIQLARNLGLEPLAEGIETEEQRAFLVGEGCTFGQGFLFSPAVPAAEVAQLVRSRARRAA